MTRGGPGAAADLFLAAYLLTTAPLLSPSGTGRTRIALLAAHVIGAAILSALAGRRGARRQGRIEGILLDLAPLLVTPILYAELPLLMEGMPGPVRYHDPTIAALEVRLFSGEPAYQWAGAWPWLPVSELLHACYVAYYPMIFVPPMLLYLGLSGTRASSGDRLGDFQETVIALEASFFACFLFFIVFPVQGPRYLGVPPGIPAGPIRGLALLLLRGGSSRGAAFPSAHVAITVTQVAMALKFQRRVGRVCFIIAIGLAAGAVYGGFHYAVDVLAGALLGVIVVPFAGAVRRRADRAAAGFTSTPGTA